MRSRSPQILRAAAPRAGFLAKPRRDGRAQRPRESSAERSCGALRGLAAALSCGALACLALACGSKQTGQPGAQSPERQSEAEYDVARDLFHKGQPRAALDHANKALSLNEDNAEASYLVAVIYLSFCNTPRGLSAPDCNMPQAEKYARAALKANPDFRDGKNLLGQILINEKKYKDAIAVLEPLTRDPAYVLPFYAWGNLGWAQVLDGQIDAGIASLRNAVTEPRFCVGFYRLGVAYAKKGDLSHADEALTSALTAPDAECQGLQDAWEERGNVRLRLGHAVDARKDYERCRELSGETATGKSCAQKLASLPAAPAAPAAPPAGGGGEVAPGGGSAASSAPQQGQ